MDERITIELLTPLTAEFTSRELEEAWEADGCTGIYEGEPLDGADLVQYHDAIQKMVDQENALGREDGKPCNLMDYFYGNPAIAEKVESAVVSVKEAEGALHGCTTLELKEYLEADELKELCEYITGQYSDGWGEGFEQREIKVEGGELYVHFWQSDDRFQFREAPVPESPKEAKIPERAASRPKLKLLGHDGNIFSIMGDAARLLRANGQGKMADEMIQRVKDSSNYYKTLGIISEYVETELSVPEKSHPPKQHRREKPAKENRER